MDRLTTCFTSLTVSVLSGKEGHPNACIDLHELRFRAYASGARADGSQLGFLPYEPVLLSHLLSPGSGGSLKLAAENASR